MGKNVFDCLCELITYRRYHCLWVVMVIDQTDFDSTKWCYLTPS